MYLAVAPCATCSDAGLGAWYDDIVDVVGEVGGRALEELKGRLSQQFGAEVWSALPDATKRSAIEAAWTEYSARATDYVPWIIAGGVVLLLVLRR